MVCQSCNSMIGPDVRFCPKCGAPATQASRPSAPPAGPGYPAPYVAAGAAPRLRVTRNLQALGILWCLYGGYRILTGLAGMFFLQFFTSHGFGHGWPFNGRVPPQFPPPWMSFFVPVIATFTVIAAVLAFVTAYGLITRRSWGRTLAIVAAVLALFKFPLGTALGIYTLYVMAPAESGVEYESITA